MSSQALPPSKAQLVREVVQTELLGAHLAKKAASTRRHLTEGTQMHRALESVFLQEPEMKNSKVRSCHGKAR